MKRISLKENWFLKEAPLSCQKEMSGYILSEHDGWYSGITLPADVHMPLIEAGVIKDPVLSDYSFEEEWIESRSWWFKKEFEMEEITAPYHRLVLEALDVHADVFLNGAYLGHHASAFYPFEREVTKYLVAGENTLLIRLTSGLEYVSDADLAEVNLKAGADQEGKRGDRRRVFVRKPAYVYGWDWAPRAATVAIAGEAYIECSDGVTLRAAAVETVAIGETARIRANLEWEVLDPLKTVDADIRAEVLFGGAVVTAAQLSDKLLCSGVNYLSFDFDIAEPRLWWPNGMGDQPLYELRVSVDHGGVKACFPPTAFGIRTVTLDLSRTGEKDRKFVFVVNGVPIFAKGGNWVPADSVYARITDEKYETLIKEAAEANFNMLRIWGGGLYERDAFYDACDRYGILVWHDFMFACASYPGHVESFYDLVCRELNYQTKRLGGRACMALWCGNNEVHCNPQLFGTFGMEIYNYGAPEYVRKNCPWIPYWNSSPYPKPSYPFVGDDHYWDYINMEVPIRIEPKVYDSVPSKFVSEYGYVGPCVKESIEAYFDGQPIEMQGRVWSHHNNAYEKETVREGIRKHYTDRELSLEEYLLYAGLVQSLMYGYSLESFRSMEHCGGGLIWMFSDCWGEVGWTIIDYYLRRKISYYGVRRALSPVKLIMREKEGMVRVFGANDTGKPVSFRMKYGYTAFDGSYDDAKTAEVTLAPRFQGDILRFPMGEQDITKGVYYAMPDGEAAPAILRCCDFKELQLCPARVRVQREWDEGEDRLMEIVSETYVHGVYLDTSCRMSDNYFDMLPNEKRIIRIEGGAGKEFTLKTVQKGE